MNITLVISMFAGLSWLLVVALLAVTVVRASRRQNIKGTVTAFVLSAVLALVLTTISKGLVFVEPQERGVVISAFAPKGYREEPLQPGLRWIIPYAESVVYYPISKTTYTMSIAASEGQIQGDDSVAARTSDGQEIFIDASVIFSIDPEQVIDFLMKTVKTYFIFYPEKNKDTAGQPYSKTCDVYERVSFVFTEHPHCDFEVILKHGKTPFQIKGDK